MSPLTKKEKIRETIHGISISDPYRWLEGNTEEVKMWVNEQNIRTQSDLENDESFKIISDEISQTFQSLSFSNPISVGGKYFYTEREPGQDQGVLKYKVGLDGESVIIFDPNTEDKNGLMFISNWIVSRTGKYVAYATSKAGDEMSTIFIKDIERDELLSDVILNSRKANVSWMPDDSGFYYTKNQSPKDVSGMENHLYEKVYFHRLGEEEKEDKLIFGENRPKDDMIGLSISLDGKFLCIDVSHNWTENEIFIYKTETSELVQLITKIGAVFSLLFLEDKVLLRTNYKANNYRVISSPIHSFFKQIDQWDEFASETEDVLEDIYASKDFVLLSYMHNACSEVIICDYEGEQIGLLPLPRLSTLMGISGRRTESEFFFGVESFTFPKMVYRFDPETKVFSIYRKMDNPIIPDEFTILQEWYASKDGTQIPMFIVHKKGIERDGKNPLVLYGYGGFSSSEMPGFLRGWIPWLKRGGIFAIPNIRGGGEFGKKWHEDGIKDKKQNSFDDFIAAAEYLIKMKYTVPNKLGILGGSNGGLLVSVVSVQRPDLFAATCAAVPLTDMVRFPRFGMAVRWVHEYGNPENKEDLISILKWSPYHNVLNKTYPSFLITTAENDSRVHPLHARKFAAILQELSENKTVYVKEETNAGHGVGKPVWKSIESQALKINFFFKYLGLKF